LEKYSIWKNILFYMDVSALHHFIQYQNSIVVECKKILVLSKSYYRPIGSGCNTFINFVIVGLYETTSSFSMDILPSMRELTIFFNNEGYITSGELWKGNEVIIITEVEVEELLSPFFQTEEIKEPSS
jgi:hypothetical protein